MKVVDIVAWGCGCLLAVLCGIWLLYVQTGVCSSGQDRLWYAAGLWGLWIQVRCGISGEDILLDWLDVFPGPVVFFALNLNVLASRG